VAAERLGFDALQFAVYQRLTDDELGIGTGYQDADGNWPVYDEVPDDEVFPYVELGGHFGEPIGNKSRSIKEQVYSLHCYSKARGTRELNDLMNAVSRSLTVLPLQLGDDFAAVDGRVSSYDVSKELDEQDESVVRHGVLRIVWIVQDVSPVVAP